MKIKKIAAGTLLAACVALLAACGGSSESYASLDEDGGKHSQGDIELIKSSSDELKVASVCMYTGYTELSKSKENREDYYKAVREQAALVNADGLSAAASKNIYNLAEKLPEDGWELRDGKSSEALSELNDACGNELVAE